MAEQRVQELEAQLVQQAAETTAAANQAAALQAQLEAFRNVPTAQAMAAAFAEALAANRPERREDGERQHRKVGG